MLKTAIPLGSIFGIEIKLHVSWFVVFVLVTWSLAAYYFPALYPAWGSLNHWLVGIATSILFFVSVLAHELAHSLVAKSNNIPVQAITLFIFGGVSQISKDPDKPEVEFKMALAGPATSLLIGGLFWILWFATRSGAGPIVGLAFWLGWINVALAAFNLIPGFPLDGGRVLRSILWWRSKDLKKATRIASNIGRGFGYLFMLGGGVLFFMGYWVNGIWFAFIGWFLLNAAAGSYRQVALQQLLRGHTVKEIMTRDCAIISPTLTVEQLVNEHILMSGRRCVTVEDNGHILGLVTTHNVKQVPRDQWPFTMVRDIVIPLKELKWVRPDDKIIDVLQLLNVEGVNQLPVLENGQMVGIIARDTLLGFIQTKTELGM